MTQSTMVLRRRLVVSLVAASLLPFTGAAWIAHSVSVEDARNAARRHVEAQAQGAASAVEAVVQRAREQASALARDRRVQTALVLNDTYTLGAMSAAGARISTVPLRPTAAPAAQVVVRAGGKAIGVVSVRLPEPGAVLRHAQAAAGSEASLSIVRGGDVLGRSGPAPPASPPASTVREQPLPAYGTGARLVVVDTARPPRATDVGARLTIAAIVSVAAIALLAFSLAKPLLTGLQVVEQAAAEADIDPLTGLSNRRSFNRSLEHELARSARTSRRCSLVLLDLDDFKTLNDVHGHTVGDDALRLVADALRAQVRAIDHVARLGGEELAVLLPETGREQAALVAERLREAIAGSSLRGADGTALTVTASLGIADSLQGSTPEGLMQRADEALYAAKRAGKNRVEIASAATASAA